MEVLHTRRDGVLQLTSLHTGIGQCFGRFGTGILMGFLSSAVAAITFHHPLLLCESRTSRGVQEANIVLFRFRFEETQPGGTP
jgi:hypothetical protein